VIQIQMEIVEIKKNMFLTERKINHIRKLLTKQIWVILYGLQWQLTCITNISHVEPMKVNYSKLSEKSHIPLTHLTNIAKDIGFLG
jgi:hypothetical protein